MPKQRTARIDFDPERISELRSIYRRMVANKAAATGISAELILGTRRTQILAKMRSEIWLELWGLGFSTTEIGNVVGRDHSSIVRSNQIIRNSTSNAGYVVRARESEQRRAAIMASRVDRAAAITRAKAEAANDARRAMGEAVEAARKAREAQGALERSMRDLVLAESDAEVQAVRAEEEMHRTVDLIALASIGLTGRKRYDAIVDTMCKLDEPTATRLWADYCRSAYPHTAANNIANPPRVWAMQMQEAA